MSARLDEDFACFITSVLVAIAGIVVWSMSAAEGSASDIVSNSFAGFCALLALAVFIRERASSGFLVVSALLAPVLYVKLGPDLRIFGLEVMVVLITGFFLGRSVKFPKLGGWQIRAMWFLFYMCLPLAVVIWTMSLQKYGISYNTLILFFVLGGIWLPCKYFVEVFEDRIKVETRIERFVG